ncbi:hypothetical protein DEI86_15355, partial [Curtobacterium sp. MCBD17_028]
MPAVAPSVPRVPRSAVGVVLVPVRVLAPAGAGRVLGVVAAPEVVDAAVLPGAGVLPADLLGAELIGTAVLGAGVLGAVAAPEVVDAAVLPGA